MQIKIGKTTKSPSSTSRKFLEVETVGAWLKDATSVVNPVLKLSRDVVFKGDVLKGYNFVYINDFKRYYYIDNVVVQDNNYVLISCTEDTLSTYYDDIKNSNHLFDRTPYYNSAVLESITPMSKYENVRTNTVAYHPSDENNVGIYLDIAGQADPSCNPTTTTYYMTIDQLKELMEKVYKPDTYASGTGAMDLISQTVCNPSQYIVGCRIGRLAIHDSTLVKSIKFGWLDIPVSGAYKVQKGMYVVSWSNDITFPNWESELNHRYQLYIPCHGTTQISAEDAAGTLTITTSVDMSNGSSFCVVRASSGKIVYYTVGQMLIPVPISGVIAKMPTSMAGLTTGLVKAGAMTASNSVPAVAQGVKGFLSSLGLFQSSPTPDPTAQATANSTPKLDGQQIVDTAVNSMLEWSVSNTGGSGTLSELFTQKKIIATTTYNNFLTTSHPTGYGNYIYTKPTTEGFYRAIYTTIKTTALSGERNDLISKLTSGFIFES